MAADDLPSAVWEFPAGQEDAVVCVEVGGGWELWHSAAGAIVTTGAVLAGDVCFPFGAFTYPVRWLCVIGGSFVVGEDDDGA